MVLLDLFLSFVKIGFTCFGGATMVPLVRAEMLSHGWMTLEEVADIVAIAEMTPGPLGSNCATFAGTRVANGIGIPGILGAIIANLGVMTPSLTLAVAVGFFLEKFRDNRILGEALTGIRPASIGMVLTVIITMGMQSYVSLTGAHIAISWQSVCIGAVAAALLWKFKLSVPIVMLISGALGIGLGLLTKFAF